jgi:tetratricopeptide (TPR) repeat protein
VFAEETPREAVPRAAWAATREAQAMELCDAALDAPSRSQRIALIDKAIALDPECLDALLLKATIDSSGPKDLIQRLEEVAELAARRLGGPAYFAENKGHFWLLLETRTYMTARAYLAEAYVDAGRTLDAIAVYEDALDLCPNDNMGVRYPLLGLYLRAGDLYRARLLSEKYEESSTVLLYGRFIAAVLSEKTDVEIRVALKRAVAENPHVAAYLAMEYDLPEFKGIHGIGDELEASLCIDCLLPAFLCDPRILTAILEFRGGAAPPSRPRKARR